MTKRHFLLIQFLAAILLPGAVMAGQADVLAVDVVETDERVYTFHVTVRHDDEGWDHYADRWDVVAPDGTVLASRTLLHPHVDEQPFTRSQPAIEIPEGIEHVEVRAHDSVHGLGGVTMTVAIPPP